MSKKIVIDKEQIEYLIKEYETSDDPFYGGKLSQLKEILAHSTEIDTDQSIEERAKECYPKMIGTNSVGVGYDMNWREKEAYIKGATEQDLISKAREKEFLEWLFNNGYKKVEKHYKHDEFFNISSKHYGIEYTTEELFNQFTNK